MGHYSEYYERDAYEERQKERTHKESVLDRLEQFRSENVRNSGLPPFVDQKLDEAIRWLKSELYTRRD